MIYYKVVRNRAGELQSVATPIIARQAVALVIYSINKWAKPNIPNSKLFTFNSLSNAKEFVASSLTWLSLSDATKGDPVLIYECEVKNPTVQKWISVTWDFDRFWKRCKDGRPFPPFPLRLYEYLRYAPIGTYTCDAVKLLKEIA